MQVANADAKISCDPKVALQFDATTVLWVGRRDLQEDALFADFPLDGSIGFAVLADGMGGHTAGDIASSIVLTEMFTELKFNSSIMSQNEDQIPSILNSAAEQANICVQQAILVNPECNGMGSTLVSPIFVNDSLYWISIGDSPFYRFRQGEMKLLNEDHSMAPDIDLMIENGMLTSEQGRNHPSRSCLKSAISGDKIRCVDCPTLPEQVLPGDIYLVASDGLQTLENATICEIIQENCHKTSAEIAKVLIVAVDGEDDPDQDNVSIATIKVDGDAGAAT